MPPAPPTDAELLAQAQAEALANLRKSARPPQSLVLGENKVENWKNFKSRWENYVLMSGLDIIARKLQLAQLENCLGDDALKTLEGLKFSTPADQRTVKEVIEAFEDFVIGQINETLERYNFGKRCQAEGESFSKFLSELRRLIKTCGYCENCEPSILRDRLVTGITNDAIREDLLKESKLTLKQCIDICKAGEAASSHKSSLCAQPEKVNKVQLKKKKKKSGKCKFCGEEHEFKKELCPAWGKKCSRCKQMNHFESCCKAKEGVKTKKKHKKVHHVAEDETSSEESDDWVNAVRRSGKKEDREVKCRMVVGKQEVDFQVDTGATCNMLPAKLAKNLEAYHGTLKMWNGATAQPIGKCRRKIRNPKTGKRYSVEFIVCEGDCQPILGLRASQHMGLVKIQEHEFHRVSTVNAEDFKDVFDGKLGTLPGTQSLRVRPDAKPVVMANRRVSISMRPAMKKELDRLEKLGVIEKVTEPTDWLSQPVLTPKKDGRTRVCIDPHELNKVLLREHYTMPVLDDTLHEMRDAVIYTKADMSDGYWHVVLDEESSSMTAFQTPFGRYKWRRLPFGLSASAEIFQKKVLESLEGLPGTVCIADDVVIHGRTQEEHDANLRGFLARCRDKGIKLNKKKLQVGLKKLSFMGHEISTEGVGADPAKVEAITKMEQPRDISALRRFMGMVNYLAKFLPNLSTVMQPLHMLLKKDVPYVWSKAQEEAFRKVKEMICQAPVLAFYDPTKPLTLENDACEYGLGSVLIQAGRPVAYASRSLTETETRYAQIEKEMLAAVYGLEKFHHYTYAREVEVITDHKPLVAISKKPLAKAPKRLQNLLLRARNYNYTITYKPGSEIPMADTLSRAPASEPRREEVVRSVTTYPIKDKLMHMIRSATAKDAALTALGEVILKGWPEEKKDVPDILRPYHSYRDELALSDGIIMRSDRVVIPASMRAEMKRRVHLGHLGINSSLRLAKDVMYWPGMSAEIRQFIETCGTCAAYGDKQPTETPVMVPIPKRAWQTVATDLFSWAGEEYLVTYDYHSNFIEVDELRNTTSGEVIKRLKAHFARHGSPETVISDNGTQFSSSEFKAFAEEWGFTHETISPGNSQANGAAEAAVKTVKRMLRKSAATGDDIYKALLHSRNTPTEGMETCPAQRLLGRRTRSMLPTTENKLKVRDIDAEKEQERKENKRHKTMPTGTDLRPLKEGETVRVQPLDGKKQWKEATVTKALTSRSYEVEAGGKVYRRNRRHLRASQASTHSKPPEARPPRSRKSATPAEPPKDTPTPPTPLTPTRSTPRVEARSPKPHMSSAHGKHTETYVTRSGRASKAPPRLINE